MSTSHKDSDRVFRVLCARALQRHGEGFPSTDEEIAAFEDSYEPTPEEKTRFAAKLSKIIEWAAARVEKGDGSRKGPARVGLSTIFEMLSRLRAKEELRAAARKAKRGELSPDLEEKIRRIIDEDQGHSDSGDQEAGDSENTSTE